MWRFCTECGKQFASGNNICPYCHFRNQPLPAHAAASQSRPARTGPSPAGIVLGALNCLPGGSGNAYTPPEEPERPARADPQHPMTAAEFEDFSTQVLIGQAAGRFLRNTHDHFVAERRHDEMMEELRRIRRE